MVNVLCRSCVCVWTFRCTNLCWQIQVCEHTYSPGRKFFFHDEQDPTATPEQQHENIDDKMHKIQKYIHVCVYVYLPGRKDF